MSAKAASARTARGKKTADAAKAAPAGKPAPKSATCKGVTKTGTRCRRNPMPGGEYCSTHAGAAGEGLSPDTTQAASNGSADSVMPNDIDRSVLDAIKHDLDADEGAFGQHPRDSHRSRGPLDEIQQIATFVGENVGRIRDAAVSTGMVEAGRVEQFLQDLVTAVAGLASAMSERASGDYEEDDFGYDARFTQGMLPIAKLLYDYYWRVDVIGVENVPAEGRGLLVSNHAGGGLPFDGAMIKVAIMAEQEAQRNLRVMVLDWMMGLPWIADFARRTGQVLACTPNALELLKRDEVVGVFPEGIKGMMKPFSQRYQLERFGRGGFVRIALRTGSPIIPVAVVGSEEIYPKVGNLPFVNKLIGAPFVPVTPLFPLFGVAGLVPMPSKWIIEFCDPIDVSQYPPEAADDRSFVLELSEQIRATIQERLRDNLLKRRTPFW